VQQRYRIFFQTGGLTSKTAGILRLFHPVVSKRERPANTENDGLKFFIRFMKK
jgi:hypothetical protein